jgi:hypothetical protein
MDWWGMICTVTEDWNGFMDWWDIISTVSEAWKGCMK